MSARRAPAKINVFVDILVGPLLAFNIFARYINNTCARCYDLPIVPQSNSEEEYRYIMAPQQWAVYPLNFTQSRANM